jgi:hypothetical protein
LDRNNFASFINDGDIHLYKLKKIIETKLLNILLNILKDFCIKMGTNIDDEWSKYLEAGELSDDYDDSDDNYNENDTEIGIADTSVAPEPTEIYISTKSKITTLNEKIDINMFWDIPVIQYYIPKEGVIKKEIKLSSKTPEDLQNIINKTNDIPNSTTYVLNSINNPNGRIKFRDVRKIIVGMSKKDIESVRPNENKQRQAFQNCIVIILRLKIENEFKEFHVKIFKKRDGNGSIEIPGVKEDTIYDIVLHKTIEIIQPFIKNQVGFNENKNTVLINSNFNCGYYINQEVLYTILRKKYNIQVIYDKCSYPGLQCKFYYNPNLEVQTGIESNEPNIIKIAFMIFRTGSVLIVGKFNENILNEVYQFLVNIFKTEYHNIAEGLINMRQHIADKEKLKIKKQRKIFITSDGL